MTTNARIRWQHSQHHLKHIRTPRELVRAKPWDASSSTSLEVISYERQEDRGVGDNDGDDDPQAGDLAGKPPPQGHRNGHDPDGISNTPASSTSDSGASNPINRPNRTPNQNQDTGRGRAPPQMAQSVAFVTLTSTKTAFVSITDTAPASTVTSTLTLIVTDMSKSRLDASGGTRNPFPTNGVAASPADPISSNSDGRTPLSGGSIAAIVIGIIIFVALIMAFVIRMMSFRREREKHWTEMDRGIQRFRDEEETFERPQKLLPNSRPAAVPFITTLEPKMPPRALRRPTIRFVTQPVQQLTDDDSDDSSSEGTLTADISPSFIPSTNNPVRNMPRAGILLNPLAFTMANS